MNTTLSTALNWLDRGISVLPIQKGSKRCPVKWKEYQSRLPELPELVTWFANDDYYLAVVCGWKNLVILDFDNIPAYVRFISEYPKFRDTFSTRTSRGMHVYVFSEDGKTTMSEDVDIKANGYCLSFPSVHPDGTPYKIAVDAEIMTVDNLPFPPSTVGGRQHNLTINNYGHIGTVNVHNNTVLGGRTDLISRIKANYPITRLFQPVKFSENGMGFAHCPTEAHPNGDRDPSLSLDLVNNRCQCISRSNCPLHSLRGNDVIDAYQKLHGLSFRQALAAMAGELGF